MFYRLKTEVQNGDTIQLLGVSQGWDLRVLCPSLHVFPSVLKNIVQWFSTFSYFLSTFLVFAILGLSLVLLIFFFKPSD